MVAQHFGCSMTWIGRGMSTAPTQLSTAVDFCWVRRRPGGGVWRGLAPGQARIHVVQDDPPMISMEGGVSYILLKTVGGTVIADHQVTTRFGHQVLQEDVAPGDYQLESSQ